MVLAMRVSFEWLSEYLKTTLSAPMLAEQLTLTGTEVEDISMFKPVDPLVIVGEIKTIVKHPHADRLQVAKVDLGRGRMFDIVCGAPNIKPGQKVPVAQVGAKLPNGLTIEAAVIRGFKSLGMICAPDELGFGEDHSGVLVLDPESIVGMPLNQALGTGDAVMHFALTPNRADCFSVIGLAREAAAVSGGTLKLPTLHLKETGQPIAKKVKVTVREPKKCIRYSARYITDVKIGPSPLWLKNRLTKAGLNSINNVVDITNYVMLETGQPLHAFDASLVANQSIIVRLAKKGEKLMTLDGVSRTLDAATLVIADSKKALAIAGVMGGQHSGISATTNAVILESAIFDQVTTRQASQRYGLRSESSHRFEKGVDPAMTTWALDRAAQLIAELAGGTVANGMVEVAAKTTKTTPVTLSLEQLNLMLSTSLTTTKVAALLERSGCTVATTKETITATAPTWRHDLQSVEDYTEEVARLYGYNRLKPTRLQFTAAPTGLSPQRLMERELKDYLAGKGLIEVMTYSYYGDSERALLGSAAIKHTEISNPLSQEQKYLRVSLVPRLFQILQKQTEDFVGIFEVGTVFRPGAARQPEEHKMLGLGYIIREGRATAPAEERLQYRWLKSVVESITGYFLLTGITYAVKPRQGWLVSIEIRQGKELLGELFITRMAKQPKRLYAFIELSYDRLAKAQNKPTLVAQSKYPLIERDVAFWVSTEHQWQGIEKAINSIGAPLVRVSLFDVYVDAEHPGKRSLAVRLTFQAPDRTLKDKEIDAAMQSVIKLLREQCGAKIRE